MQAYFHEEITTVSSEIPISTSQDSLEYGTMRESSKRGVDENGFRATITSTSSQQQQRLVIVNTENPINYQNYVVETPRCSSPERNQHQQKKQMRETEERDGAYSYTKKKTQFHYQSLADESSTSRGGGGAFRNFLSRNTTKARDSFVRIPRTPGFITMSDNKFGHQSKVNGILLNIEKFLNIICHAIIAFITIYMSWMCLKTGLSGTALHAWLVTLGFVFLMAEGVMCHYSANIFTVNLKRDQKTRIHWILQATGGSLGILGILAKMIQKGFSLHSTHSKLGFGALVLCCVSMLSGLSALYSMRLKNLLSPLFNKAIHNYFGFITLFLGLLAQFFGYSTGYFMRRTENDFRVLMEILTLLLLIFSSIGPLRGIINKSLNVVRQYR